MTETDKAAGPLPFRERLTWEPAHGEIRDGEIRYLMIRPDALMGLLHHLPAAMRGPVLAAFAASVQAHGGGSARKYREMGAAAPAALLEVIAATAPQLGWGCWRFAEIAADRLCLDVVNSPFADGHGPSDGPVCAPVAGMLAAVAGMVLDGSATVEETACQAAGAPACRFEARRSPSAGGTPA